MVGRGLRQRADDDLAQRLVEHAAVAHAHRGPDEQDLDRRLDLLEQVDLLEVHVEHRAAHRVELGVLEEHRAGVVALDREVDHRAAASASTRRSSRSGSENASDGLPGS